MIVTDLDAHDERQAELRDLRRLNPVPEDRFDLPDDIAEDDNPSLDQIRADFLQLNTREYTPVGAQLDPKFLAHLNRVMQYEKKMNRAIPMCMEDALYRLSHQNPKSHAAIMACIFGGMKTKEYAYAMVPHITRQAVEERILRGVVLLRKWMN